MSDHYCEYIVEDYDCEFVIAEDMVFDEPEIIEQYGRKIVIRKGNKGTIHDWMTYPYDLNGYEFIEANLPGVSAAISFNHGEEKAVYQAADIYIHSRDKYIIVFDVGKLESSESILEGYKQSRKKFNSKITKAKVTGISTGLGISIVISAIVLLAYHHHKENYYH